MWPLFLDTILFCRPFIMNIYPKRGGASAWETLGLVGRICPKDKPCFEGEALGGQSFISLFF